MTAPRAVGEWADGEEPVDTLGDDLVLEEVPAGDVGELPPPRYATLDEFVQEFLLEMLWIDVEVSSRTWCPKWWNHPAAIVRLEALHRSFEHLRLDPTTGISVWLRDHADYHMGLLTDPNGPFKGCSIKKGHDDQRGRVIPFDPAPIGLFDTDD